jgi:hypothetical protein
MQSSLWKCVLRFLPPAAPDLTFWPSKKHKFGWYLEPSYDYKFGPGHEHSLGVSGGLLISAP